jgi:type VI secretion system protein ImpH
VSAEVTPEPTAFERLVDDPEAFGFDAALRLLLHRAVAVAPADADLAEAARFATRPGLGYARSDILAVELAAEGPPKVTLGLLGMTGVAGVMPRRYSEDAARENGTALHEFTDMLAHRMLADLGHAGMKYRLDRAVETARITGDPHDAPHVRALLAMAGFGEPGAVERLPFGTDALLHYAGLFAMRPRSAERLAALATDFLGLPVEVVEFKGAWLPIEPEQRSRLPVGREARIFCCLGRDAAVGTRAWDPQARVVLRIGPLDLTGFEALLPNRPALVAFVGLVRAYLGYEVGFGVNLVLAAEEVPKLELAAKRKPGALLGWNTWLGRGKGYVARGDAEDARFAAEMVEIGIETRR